MIDLNQLVKAGIERQQYLEAHGLYFLGEIDDDAAERLGQALVTMSVEREGQADKPITVYINSGGGSVGAGLGMMQMIYRMRALHKVTINTVVTGYAYSMGAIVFQAGDKRQIGSFSTLMLHEPQWSLSGTDQQVFSDYATLARHYGRSLSRTYSLNARASTTPSGGSASYIQVATAFSPPRSASAWVLPMKSMGCN